MTMIEQAARALAASQCGVDDWDAYDEEFQQALLEHARAMLAAVREPSPAVVREGAGRLWAGSGELADKQARETWQIMIDAALGERA
jgi:hypothetical protein